MSKLLAPYLSMVGISPGLFRKDGRSEEHTSELQSPCNLVCRLLLEKKINPHSQRSYNPPPFTHRLTQNATSAMSLHLRDGTVSSALAPRSLATNQPISVRSSFTHTV